jgi:hypothetical protein
LLGIEAASVGSGAGVVRGGFGCDGGSNGVAAADATAPAAAPLARPLPPAPALGSVIVADFPGIFAELRGKRFSLLWRGGRDGFDFHARGLHS